MPLRPRRPGDSASSNSLPSLHDRYVAAVEVTRGTIVESVHAAAIAVSDAAGRVTARLGGVDHIVYMRSAVKPIQAMAVIESGAVERFAFDDEEIAVMCGSHGSEARHVATVERILRKCGLGPEALRCGTHAPFNREVADSYRRSGRALTPLEHNCSGKHAGMLAAAIAGGHDPGTYFESSHPVQQRILGVIADITGRMRDMIVTGADGCGVPAIGITLAEAARAFARLAAPDTLPGKHGDAARRVVAAMRAHPFMIAGTGMADTQMTGFQRHGLIAKRGAEGVQCLAFVRDGVATGVAAKIADGNNGRARIALARGILQELGLMDGEALEAVDEGGALRIRNDGGREIGRVRPAFTLQRV